jgi:hypothetical protein
MNGKTIEEGKEKHIVIAISSSGIWSHEFDNIEIAKQVMEWFHKNTRHQPSVLLVSELRKIS